MVSNTYLHSPVCDVEQAYTNKFESTFPSPIMIALGPIALVGLQLAGTYLIRRAMSWYSENSNKPETNSQTEVDPNKRFELSIDLYHDEYYKNVVKLATKLRSIMQLLSISGSIKFESCSILISDMSEEECDKLMNAIDSDDFKIIPIDDKNPAQEGEGSESVTRYITPNRINSTHSDSNKTQKFDHFLTEPNSAINNL